MSKPDWCPQRVWDEAALVVACLPISAFDDRQSIEMVARAILAAEQRGAEREREQCALVAEIERRTDLAIKHGYKPTWLVISHDIAAAIRNRTGE